MLSIAQTHKLLFAQRMRLLRIFMFRSSAALILSLCAACGFSSEPRSTVFPIDFDAPCNGEIEILDELTVRFCGETSQRAVERLIDTLERGSYSRLVIDSLGGNTQAAIKFGRFLNGRGTALYVNHVCLSSCSQFVMLGATRVFLRESSIIGMHDTQSSTNTLIAEQYVRREMVEEARIERTYYSEIGAPNSLLYEPMNRLGIECILNPDEYLQTGAMTLKSEYDYFVPDEDFIARVYPGSLMTPWPDAEAVRKRLNEVNLKLRMNLDQSSDRALELPIAVCSE